MSRYPGGKNAPGVAQRIISEIPRHRVFAEIFGGSAAVTRTMLPAERNIVLDPSTVARFSGQVPHAEYLHANALAWLAEAEIDADWCIYADPPYHPDTLRGPQKYACKFDAGAHLRLLVDLMALPCPVLDLGVSLPALRCDAPYLAPDRLHRSRSAEQRQVGIALDEFPAAGLVA